MAEPKGTTYLSKQRSAELTGSRRTSPWRPTSVTEVVDQDDLFQQNSRCGLQNAVDSPQQGGPGLVVEGDNHGRGGQLSVVERLASASEGVFKSEQKETNI